MMYLLFLVACLADEPAQCTPESFELAAVTNATGCHLAGHFRLARWLDDNPEKVIAEARCITLPTLTDAGAAVSASAVR